MFVDCFFCVVYCFCIFFELVFRMVDERFDEWNIFKKRINVRNNQIFFHEREIWFVHLGKNVGHEQDGGSEFLRPVIILKKFNQRLFWGIPLSMKKKEGKFYFIVTDKKDGKIIAQRDYYDLWGDIFDNIKFIAISYRRFMKKRFG